MKAAILVLICWVTLVVYWNVSAGSVKRAEEQQSLAAKLARMPVWLGFVLLLVAWMSPLGLLVIPRSALSDSLGVAICASGLFVAIWSRRALGAEWSQDVELKQGHRLVQSGPYRLMRHPIYTGHLLMGLGTAIAAGRLIAYVGFALFAVGLWIKLRQEEKLLLHSFPDDYAAYRRRVKALIPYLF